MTQPLMIDLYCGLGGWAEGGLAEGYFVVGFDNERHEYGEHRYPGDLVIQDVRTLHGSQFKDATLIVASPPCQEYSYMAMPWKKAKAVAADYRSGKRDMKQLTALFDACFRIQREASEAAGRHIPLIVENVKGAQPWVGGARANFGSFYFWGDVPALMPKTHRAKVPGFRFDGNGGSFQSASVEHTGTKNNGGSWFAIAHNTTSGKGQNPDGRKTGGPPHMRDGHPHTKHLTNPDEHAGIKHHGSGAVWFDTGPAALSSKSHGRKAASAMIAKIPPEISTWIARCFKPISYAV